MGGSQKLNSRALRVGVMAKAAAVALFALLVCALLMGAPALAASLNVSVDVQPETLSDAGTVDISFNLSNSGSVMVEDIMLSGPSIKDTAVGNLDAGSSKAANIRGYKISKEKLGEPLSFKFTWTEGGQEQSTTQSITVGVKETEPKLSFTRSLSKTAGAPGDEITVTYALQNTGNADLTKVAVTDFGKTIEEGIELAVGSSVKRIEHKLVLEGENVVSEPVATAEADGKKLEEKAAAQTITVAEASLLVSVTAGNATAEGAPVEILVQNNGNVTFKDITITDEKGTAITETGFTLAAGGENRIPYTVSDAPREFVATVKGTPDSEGGTEQTFASTPVPLEAYVSPEDITLTLELDPARIELTEPGEVTVKVRITNTGPVAMTGAVLQPVGAEKPIDMSSTIEPGTQEFDLKFAAEQSYEMEFKLTANGDVGMTYEDSATLAVVLAGSELPVDDGTLDEPAPKSRTLLYVVIGLGVLLVVAIIVLAVLLAQDARKKAREEEDEEIDSLVERASSRKERKRLEQEIDRTFGTDDDELEFEEQPRRGKKKERAPLLGGRRKAEEVPEEDDFEPAVAGTTFSDDRPRRRGDDRGDTRRRRREDEEAPRRTVHAAPYENDAPQRKPMRVERNEQPARGEPPREQQGRRQPPAAPQRRPVEGGEPPRRVPPRVETPEYGYPAEPMYGEQVRRQPPAPPHRPVEGGEPLFGEVRPQRGPMVNQGAPVQTPPAAPAEPMPAPPRQNAPMAPPEAAPMPPRQAAPAAPPVAQPPAAPMAQPGAPVAQPPAAPVARPVAPVAQPPAAPAAPAARPVAPAAETPKRHSTSDDWALFEDEFSEF